MNDEDTPYRRLGGAQAVSGITERFYDLIEQDAAYGAVRAIHGVDLTRLHGALTGFLTGWLGGPRDYFTNGGPCMVSLHRKLPIGADAARQWASAMRRAISDQPGVDAAIGTAMADALGRMADGMVNR